VVEENAALLGEIICYPHASEDAIKARMTELSRMGVSYIIFTGKTILKQKRVLGKGKDGIVVSCVWKGREAAAKILRTDSTRRDLDWEANMLRFANSAGVGPELYCVDKNILVMKRIHGKSISEAFKAASCEQKRELITKLLEKARALDKIGLRHKELSNASKHVIVSCTEPEIIDFGSCVLGSRGHNVAALCQYIVFRELGMKRDSLDIFLQEVRSYRKDPCESNYRKVLTEMVKLT